MTIIGKTNIDINIDVKLLFSFFLGAGSFSTPPALLILSLLTSINCSGSGNSSSLF